MKKGFLFLMMVFLVFILTGCKEETHVMLCEFNNEELKYVYTDKEIVGYYKNGVKKDTDLFGREMADVTDIDSYLSSAKKTIEFIGGDCR